jgi:hypothetical protein
VERWKEVRWPDLRPATRAAYDLALRHALAWFGVDCPVSEVRTGEIERYIAAPDHARLVEADGAQQPSRPRSDLGGGRPLGPSGDEPR